MKKETKRFLSSTSKVCGTFSVRAAVVSLLIYVVGYVCNLVLDLEDIKEAKQNKRN